MTSKLLRTKFLEQFRGQEFSREDVEEFLKPYYEFDAEKAYRQGLAREARKFISSIRDMDNIRECLSYEWEGKTFFGWPLAMDEIGKLQKMEERNMKQKYGLERTLAKIQSRIWMLKHQITIFDFMQHKRKAQGG